MTQIRVILVILSVALLGCEDRPTAANPVTQKPTPDPAQAATTQPAAPPVVLVVDEQPREFPPARLVVESRNGKTVALLMSDDPKEAIDDDYTGNSYYLEMRFDEEIDSLRDRVWQYQATAAAAAGLPARADSPDGIFLEGNRKQLQPFDLKVHFEHGKAEGGDVAWISGTFTLYEESAGDGGRPPPPRLVSVAGRVPVKIP